MYSLDKRLTIILIILLLLFIQSRQKNVEFLASEDCPDDHTPLSVSSISSDCYCDDGSWKWLRTFNKNWGNFGATKLKSDKWEVQEEDDKYTCTKKTAVSGRDTGPDPPDATLTDEQFIQIGLTTFVSSLGATTSLRDAIISFAQEELTNENLQNLPKILKLKEGKAVAIAFFYKKKYMDKYTISDTADLSVKHVYDEVYVKYKDQENLQSTKDLGQLFIDEIQFKTDDFTKFGGDFHTQPGNNLVQKCTKPDWCYHPTSTITYKMCDEVAGWHCEDTNGWTGFMPCPLGITESPLEWLNNCQVELSIGDCETIYKEKFPGEPFPPVDPPDDPWEWVPDKGERFKGCYESNAGCWFKLSEVQHLDNTNTCTVEDYSEGHTSGWTKLNGNVEGCKDAVLEHRESVLPDNCKKAIFDYYTKDGPGELTCTEGESHRIVAKEFQDGVLTNEIELSKLETPVEKRNACIKFNNASYAFYTNEYIDYKWLMTPDENCYSCANFADRNANCNANYEKNHPYDNNYEKIRLTCKENLKCDIPAGDVIGKCRSLDETTTNQAALKKYNDIYYRNMFPLDDSDKKFCNILCYDSVHKRTPRFIWHMSNTSGRIYDGVPGDNQKRICKFKILKKHPHISQYTLDPDAYALEAISYRERPHLLNINGHDKLGYSHINEEDPSNRHYMRNTNTSIFTVEFIEFSKYGPIYYIKTKNQDNEPVYLYRDDKSDGHYIKYAPESKKIELAATRATGGTGKDKHDNYKFIILIGTKEDVPTDNNTTQWNALNTDEKKKFEHFFNVDGIFDAPTPKFPPHENSLDQFKKENQDVWKAIKDRVTRYDSTSEIKAHQLHGLSV